MAVADVIAAGMCERDGAAASCRASKVRVNGLGHDSACVNISRTTTGKGGCCKQDEGNVRDTIVTVRGVVFQRSISSKVPATSSLSFG